MLGIPIALAVSNIAEWLIHKHVLHHQGRVKGSFWSFHWHEHHRNARANGFEDPETHEQGVNNQLFRALGCFIAERGTPTTRPTWPAQNWRNAAPRSAGRT